MPAAAVVQQQRRQQLHFVQQKRATLHPYKESASKPRSKVIPTVPLHLNIDDAGCPLASKILVHSPPVRPLLCLFNGGVRVSVSDR